MSSPLPPDPYETLGVSKDADVAAIRTAHRKLVLKHHPDRIRDEAERERGKNEFQKIQQAYEILTDPTSRSRYDDRVRLAELRKQRMTRPAAQPTPASAPAPTTSARYERSSDESAYEMWERVPRPPPTTYFDQDHYDEPIPRAPARKADPYEKKSTPPRPVERKEKVNARWFGPMDGVSYKVATQMKARAAEAKSKNRDAQRLKAEVRDKEKRRDRSEKHSSRRAPYVEDDSDSDSDTVVPRTVPRPQPNYRPRNDDPEAEMIRGPVPPPRRPVYDDDERDVEKWEQHHKNTRSYIAEAQRRPDLSRSNSEAYYWEGDSRGGRRSGSDGEKRAAPKSRRSAADDGRPRPSMPVHTSEPSKLRHSVEPPRSKTSSYPTERDSRRDPPPSLGRSQTMPVRPKREGNLPSRGSNLKHSEVQPDSGYYSSSNPHTPEMRGDSPPRDLPREASRRQHTSVKYAIVDPADDSDEQSVIRGPRINRARIINNPDDDMRRLHHSPERMAPRDRERERERERERDSDRERPRDRATRPRLTKLETDTGRPRSARTPPSVARADFSRYESQSPREMYSTKSSKLYGEIDESVPPSAYVYPQPPVVRTSSHRQPTYATYRQQSPDEYGPDSRFKQSANYPTTRRLSAY